MDDLEEELDALERVICGQKKPDSLDFQLLRRLTGNFSDDRMIGAGGCGKVYRGILPNGVVIAVKKLKKDTQNAIDENMFLREVDSMIKAEHQNIVRFLGYCSEIKKKAVQVNGTTVMAEDTERLLCFQYISKGSLDKHLTDELRGFGWDTRYQIIKGICDGLLYLHHHKSILHMDLKPDNILLGDQMVPKITDFGLSRNDGKTLITRGPLKYSPGYCAPEYIDNGERSCKSDIYSLGVIMMELVTGSRKMPNKTKVLRRWRHRWNKSSKHTPLCYLQVKKCLELAVSCQERDRINRPFISDVVRELNKLDSWDGQIRESSLEKIISSSDDMLGIEPLELHFSLAHNKQISCSVELTNDTDHYMAFRIATTSLLPFSIQPNEGIAAPRSRCRTTITLPAQEMAQLHNHRNKEFIIVQSTRIDGSLTAADITVQMFDEEGGYCQKKIDGEDKVVDEVNLVVLFDMLQGEHQKDVANLSAEMGSLRTSSQEVQQSVELSPHHAYEDPRHIEVLECILDRRQSPSRLPFSLLRYITADFSDERMVGSGGCGKVYKGILGNKIVAVKRLFKSHTIDSRMFHGEIATTLTVEHKNIVRFLGYCSHTEEEAIRIQGKFVVSEIRERLLCFEYISTGSLDTYVTDELRGLEWHTRYQIILGICEALQHLHKEKHIIHMDLKPANILLDDHMVPKITDFGISRFEEKSQTMSSDMSSDRLVSIGYCAPEYLCEGRMSARSDIYSLGVVIIELVTGSKESPNINSVLRRWRHRWNKSAKYTPLWHQQVTKCLELALRCKDYDPTRRPHIWDIIQELIGFDTCAREESADQLTNSCLDDLLGIEPLELQFPVELSRQQSRSIQLTNDTDHYIAFMTILAKQSSLSYSVQPDKGVVPPRSVYSVTITLKAQEEESHWKIRDNIFVLSTRVDGGVTAADISQDMFNNKDENKVVDKVGVMVILDTP